MSIEDEATGHARLRRIHLPNDHLQSAFGNDWFGKKAEDFARFFGTPTFLGVREHLIAIHNFINGLSASDLSINPCSDQWYGMKLLDKSEKTSSTNFFLWWITRRSKTTLISLLISGIEAALCAW